MTTKATIHVPGLKVTVPLAADALPRDLVPMEGPAGEPTLELVLDGGPLTARAQLNGKNYRKMLKQIAEHQTQPPTGRPVRAWGPGGGRVHSPCRDDIGRR